MPFVLDIIFKLILFGLSQIHIIKYILLLIHIISLLKWEWPKRKQKQRKLIENCFLMYKFEIGTIFILIIF